MRHVLVVGGGGREHALAWKLAQSPRVGRISVAPGNAGTAQFAHNVDIDATDIVSLMEFAETEQVDLTVVGPEEPLASGLVDQFEAAGMRIFGPRRQAALIETSKSFAKRLMIAHGVPTPRYEVVTNLEDAREFLLTHPVDRVVIKADGLARGKGVFLPRGETDAEGILRSLLERDALGGAGRRVILEERLHGDELSLMAFTDGHTLALMPSVREYKRLRDEGIGPNTGGMGAHAPAPAVSRELALRISREIIEPALAGLQSDNCCFAGVIYVDVMLTPTGPQALELNARFGDPGAQAVLPLLETDLLDVIDACIDGTLNTLDVRWSHDAAVSVVLATAGYPERSDPGLRVAMTRDVPDDVLMFHAGTRWLDSGVLVTTGGRVLDVTGVGPDLTAAAQCAYRGVRCVSFDGMQYRRDIGLLRSQWE
ncbi:MAG TPA: phosphoribosylamine--glycine ligase [Aggregatilinea sp.]|uniref:phosphoribosylamine--glycine ligase n=1 Tax=Aggregatilinea sp. TaxID=2806333 RepID=UPI002C8AAB4D|nr:phosphoribosylamine--glycine ligase [Aggregatilinea sp.]HML24623.1 phosphoribosylamine--glycine ligase [Aggregatilinea sp.]